MTGLRLDVEAVTHRFGGIEALHDVSLSAEPGSLVAVIGPNGAGKTTLLDVISGRLRPTRGAVRWGGADLTRLPPHRVAALGIGRTFQIARLFPGLPAVDNVLVGVTFGAAPARSAEERRRRAGEILDAVGLADKGGLPASRLSLGEQKRLELAVALGAGPRLLLLDELGGGLPPRDREGIHGVCDRLREGGVTVIAIEHGAEGLARRADQVLLLDQGNVVGLGPPDDVLASRTLAAAYL
ncbi:MAG: ATP-binding cassette domain-containing protein, partial [Candidatus Rokuibacteriota bacterium]